MTDDPVFWEKAVCILVLGFVLFLLMPAFKRMMKADTAERFQRLAEKIKDRELDQKERDAAAKELLRVFLPNPLYRQETMNLITVHMPKEWTDKALIKFHRLMEKELAEK